MQRTRLRGTKRIGVWRGVLLRPVSAIVLTAALAIGVVAPFATPSPSAAQAIDFAPGDSVVVDTDALNMRSGPGTATTVTDVLVSGTVGTVTDGPVIGPDWTWFEINVAGVGSGWVAGEFLALADDGGNGEFPVGSVVFVNTDAVNVRSAAGLDGSVVGQLVQGELAAVLNGPVSEDGYDWYRLGREAALGWVAGEFLALSDEGSIEFPIGAIVAVNTDLLNVRAAPGLDGRRVDTIGFGATGEVSRDPVAADGHTWYRLRIANAADGWVAGEFLVLAGSELIFPIGSDVRVDTDLLNVRAAPGLNGRIVDRIGFGAVGEVSRDPVEADGHTWYRLRLPNAADGWVAGEFLIAA